MSAAKSIDDLLYIESALFMGYVQERSLESIDKNKETSITLYNQLCAKKTPTCFTSVFARIGKMVDFPHIC